MPSSWCREWPYLLSIATFAIVRLRDLVSALTALGYMIVTAALVRLGIGYLCAGTAGLACSGNQIRIAGRFRTEFGTPVTDDGRECSRFWRGAMCIKGLAVLFGLPLAAMVTLVFRRHDESEGDGDLQAIAAYSLTLIVVLLVVVAYFTTSL